jgi:hypothetical protein
LEVSSTSSTRRGRKRKSANSGVRNGEPSSVRRRKGAVRKRSGRGMKRISTTSMAALVK